MIVSHNMAAINGNRQLKISSNKKTKSSEKLSSGYRINRSADDAAGLAISEKMRRQIRGLNKASNNAEEGISLIQTAEGALNEVHDILQRMNELATQAANDTNVAQDRQAIQEEMDELRTELNRISDTTTFNTRPILKAKQLIEIEGGDLSDVTLGEKCNITTPNGTSRTVNGVSMDFANVTSSNINDLAGKSFYTTCTANCSQIFTFNFTDSTSSDAIVSGSNMTVNIGINDNSINNGTDVVNKIIELVTNKQSDPPFSSYQNSNGDLFIGHANGISSDGSKLIFYSISGGPPYSSGMGKLKAADMVQLEETLHFQIGANEGEDLKYIIQTINTDSLKLDKLDVSTHKNAGNTMTKIQNAISFVSDYRAYLGATQNRLEHTIANLDNTSENTQIAESLIRDTDMATEMIEYSKSNILQQTGQSILAQANLSTQGILTLLQ